MPHPLDETLLPGLSDDAVRSLGEAGYRTVEDLIMADPDQLAQVGGLDSERVRSLTAAAGALLAEGKDVIPFQHVPPTAEQLSRGLRAARAIEHTTGLVRKARSHAGRRASRKHEWSHRRARRQLKKLRRSLEELQRHVLAQGISTARLDVLSSCLTDLDTQLEGLVAGPANKDFLKTVRRLAKRGRKHLELV